MNALKSQSTRTRKPPMNSKNIAPSASNGAPANVALQRASSVNAPGTSGSIGDDMNDADAAVGELRRGTVGAIGGGGGGGLAGANGPYGAGAQGSAAAAGSSTTHYNAPEEPLHNPEN